MPRKNKLITLTCKPYFFLWDDYRILIIFLRVSALTQSRPSLSLIDLAFFKSVFLLIFIGSVGRSADISHRLARRLVAGLFTTLNLPLEVRGSRIYSKVWTLWKQLMKGRMREAALWIIMLLQSEVSTQYSRERKKWRQ